ncbi:MAG: phosphate acyltransferase PlsX [Candidatus Cloacimonadota bacterium]|nr:MAG: phosphate acyltransferase PlsX [Candidatus Cloacimonadota bacterium]
MAVVLDAMGGDKAPHLIVEGAIQAADLGMKIHLVGISEKIEPLAKSHKNISIVHASDVVGMCDSPSSVLRKKKESSIAVGVRLAKELKIPFVSAGNTGACMAAALFTFGRISGIKRPPIASIFPQTTSGSCIVLDVGANVDCDVENLLQFALLGVCYAQTVLGLESPRVGLLSNGQEDKKGNILTLEANQALRESSLNFIGNVEGFDVLSGNCDVVVCDGFVGNVLLKTAEGILKLTRSLVKKSLSAKSLPSEDFSRFIQEMSIFDPYKPIHCGAPLLGIKGHCSIVHGGADAKTILGACISAEQFGQSKILAKIQETIQG